MMDVDDLCPIVRKACHLEDLDPQSKGEFLKTLCLCAELDESDTKCLFETVVGDMDECGLLESCEFHEGLSNTISFDTFCEIIIEGNLEDSAEKIARVVSSYYASGTSKLKSETWNAIKLELSSGDVHKLISRIAELSCNNLSQIAELLGEVYDDFEKYDLADSVRVILASDWILDMLPSNKRRAMRKITTILRKRFPCASNYIDEFCKEVFGLEYNSDDELSDPPSGAPGREGSSSDSDIESRGSLDDFVVDTDDDEDEDGDESESSLSSSSDERGKRKLKKMTRSMFIKKSKKKKSIKKGRQSSDSDEPTFAKQRRDRRAKLAKQKKAKKALTSKKTSSKKSSKKVKREPMSSAEMIKMMADLKEKYSIDSLKSSSV